MDTKLRRLAAAAALVMTSFVARADSSANPPHWEFNTNNGVVAEGARFYTSSAINSPARATDPSFHPIMAEVALQWPASPDASIYRVYVKSSRTTNEWVRAAVVNDTSPTVSYSLVVDLSVPVWTRVTAVDSGGQESLPTMEVRHPAIVPPRPPGQHRHMFSKPLSEAVPHRSRIEPLPVQPLPPTP